MHSLKNAKKLICIPHIKAGTVVSDKVDGFAVFQLASHLDNGVLFSAREFECIREKINEHLS